MFQAMVEAGKSSTMILLGVRDGDEPIGISEDGEGICHADDENDPLARYAFSRHLEKSGAPGLFLSSAGLLLS